MSEQKKDVKRPTEIYLRSYPKVIFFWPLLITSLVLMILQIVAADVDWIDPTILGYTWFIVFFVNIFVTAFDFSSTKFFVLILAIVIFVLIVVFLVLPNFTLQFTNIQLDLALPWEFYMVMTLILAFILAIL